MARPRIFASHNSADGHCLMGRYIVQVYFAGHNPILDTRIPVLCPDFVCNAHYISNRNFCCFSYIIAMVHRNSLTVEFWQEKIEGNLRRANTEPSVDLRRANTELSVDFRKANTESSVHFRRANTETYYK